jgi:PAS domain S-box-containing protein
MSSERRNKDSEIEALHSRIRCLEERLSQYEGSARLSWKQTEQALQVQGNEYMAVVEMATELICRYRRDTSLTFVNSAYCEYYRMEKKELIGKSFLPFNPPEERSRITEKLASLSHDNPVILHEGPAILPWSREYRWQQWSNKAIFNNAGEVIEIQSVGIDTTEKRKTEEALRTSEKMLKAKAEELERKNIALREIMEQIGIEKNQIREDIVTNVHELIFPIIGRMKQRASEKNMQYIRLLENHLEELAGSFGRSISNPMLKLSPREIEICTMIRGGISSKEIAESLHVSYFTIESHRNAIRKKLGLNNEKVNLATYLQSL